MRLLSPPWNRGTGLFTAKQRPEPRAPGAANPCFPVRVYCWGERSYVSPICFSQDCKPQDHPGGGVGPEGTQLSHGPGAPLNPPVGTPASDVLLLDEKSMKAFPALATVFEAPAVFSLSLASTGLQVAVQGRRKEAWAAETSCLPRPGQGSKREHLPQGPMQEIDKGRPSPSQLIHPGRATRMSLCAQVSPSHTV